MPTPQHADAIAYALKRLELELAPELTYHSLWHTKSDVMPSAIRLAQLSEVPEAEIALLEVAAAFHDVGYVEGYQDHELISARIAAQELPRFGFSSREIERILGLILATRLPQSPRNLLEEIMADADLDALGRDDFFERSNALRQEMALRGISIAATDWRDQQRLFLEGHRYFTTAARQLRDQEKQRHIEILRFNGAKG